MVHRICGPACCPPIDRTEEQRAMAGAMEKFRVSGAVATPGEKMFQILRFGPQVHTSGPTAGRFLFMVQSFRLTRIKLHGPGWMARPSSPPAPTPRLQGSAWTQHRVAGLSGAEGSSRTRPLSPRCLLRRSSLGASGTGAQRDPGWFPRRSCPGWACPRRVRRGCPRGAPAPDAAPSAHTSRQREGFY